MREAAIAAGVRRWLIGGTLALFAGRLALSLLRSGPVLVADEAGYLTNARVLAGGLAGQLDHAPFYRGGYSLLLAPLLSATSDPRLAYHLVLVLNAGLAASLVPLLHVLLTRCGGVAPRAATIPALAGAAYAPVTVLSQVAMSENLLFPLTCVWLIAVCGALGEPRARGSLPWAVALGASGAALWAVHGRMIVVVALTAAAALWLGVRRSPRRASAAATLLTLAGGLLATHVLNAFLIDRNHGGDGGEDAVSRFGDVLHGDALVTVATNLLGQAWYLGVATFGLAIVVGAHAVRRSERTSDPELRRLVVALVTLTGLLLAVSAAAFPERTRPDMLIYGRYVEVAAPPLVALGIVLLPRRRTLAPVLALAALSAAVVLIRGVADDPGAANRWNIAGLPFVTSNLQPAVLIGAAAVGSAGAWLLTGAGARLRAQSSFMALALIAPVIAYGIWSPVVRAERAVYPGGWTSPEAAAQSAGMRCVDYDLAHYDAIGLYTLQWFLPASSVQLLRAGERPPSRFVLSARTWPLEHPGQRPVALWKARGRDAVLWRLPVGGSECARRS
jgi:hypothetical protein